MVALPKEFIRNTKEKKACDLIVEREYYQKNTSIQTQKMGKKQITSYFISEI